MIQFTRKFILDNLGPSPGLNNLRFSLNVNGYLVSIIGGGMAYGDGVDTFEVMVTKGEDVYTKDVFPSDVDPEDQVAGHLPLDKLVYGLNMFFADETYV